MIKTIIIKLQNLIKLKINPENKELSYIFISAACLIIARCFNTAVERHYLAEWLEWALQSGAFVILVICFIILNIKLR